MRPRFSDLWRLFAFDGAPRTNHRHESARLRRELDEMEHRAVTAENEVKRLVRVIERAERVMAR